MNRLHKAGVLTLLGAATCAALAMPVAGAEPEPTPTPTPATAAPATAAPVATATAEPVATAVPLPATAAPAAPAPAGEPCSSAGLSATMSSVMKATSDYLVKHPEVDQALLAATQQSAFVAIGQMDDFFAAHPQEADEVRGIQQPARDYQNRCGLVVEPAEAFMALQSV